MPAHILLVDDDALLIDAVRFSLEKAGYTVHSALTSAEAVAVARRQPLDLAVLDIGLPDMDGLHLSRQLKADQPDLPFIFLTAHDREMDIILGFERGADDYVTKPFSMGELLARVGVVLRRGRQAASPPAPQRFAVGEVEMDLIKHVVRVRGESVDVPPKHFELLKLLISRPGEALNRQEIVDAIWGVDYFGDTRVLDVYVRGLRELIERDPSNPTHLLTVRGVGYKFREA